MPDRRVSRIRVPATYQVDGTGPRIAVAEFRLGLGPCGKTVVRLDAEIGDTLLAIDQDHDDGTTIRFIYRVEHLTGRVEIELA